MLQCADQVLVAADGLGPGLLQVAEDRFQPVEGDEDEAHRRAGDRHAVAELAHQRLGGVRQRFEARHAEEAAGALDGVYEPENVAQDRLVVRILLESDEFGIHGVEVLGTLGEELTQQVVHERYSVQTRTTVRADETLTHNQLVKGFHRPS